MNVIAKYNRWLVNKPLTSRLFTGTSLLTVGDFLAQTLLEQRGFGRKKCYNYTRSLKTLAFGACLTVPQSVLWYSRILPRI